MIRSLVIGPCPSAPSYSNSLRVLRVELRHEPGIAPERFEKGQGTRRSARLMRAGSTHPTYCDSKASRALDQSANRSQSGLFYPASVLRVTKLPLYPRTKAIQHETNCDHPSPGASSWNGAARVDYMPPERGNSRPQRCDGASVCDCLG